MSRVLDERWNLFEDKLHSAVNTFYALSVIVIHHKETTELHDIKDTHHMENTDTF